MTWGHNLHNGPLYGATKTTDGLTTGAFKKGLKACASEHLTSEKDLARLNFTMVFTSKLPFAAANYTCSSKFIYETCIVKGSKAFCYFATAKR